MKLVPLSEVPPNQKFFDVRTQHWYILVLGSMAEAILPDGLMSGRLEDFADTDMVEIPDPE